MRSGDGHVVTENMEPVFAGVFHAIHGDVGVFD
jgi:hypothetical protein